MTQEHDAETVERVADKLRKQLIHLQMWQTDNYEKLNEAEVDDFVYGDLLSAIDDIRALSAMPAREVTVREAARVLLKDMQTRLPSVETYDDPVFSSIYEFDTTSYVLNALVGDKP